VRLGFVLRERSRPGTSQTWSDPSARALQRRS